jgi:hypothetical protein
MSSTEYEIMISKKVPEKTLQEMRQLIQNHPELGYWTMSEFIRLVSRGKLTKKQ